MPYPNYDARESDCTAFLRKRYPGAIKPRVINGANVWTWENIDGHIFAFETEGQAAADLCRDMGVTDVELAGARQAP